MPHTTGQVPFSKEDSSGDCKLTCTPLQFTRRVSNASRLYPKKHRQKKRVLPKLTADANINFYIIGPTNLTTCSNSEKYTDSNPSSVSTMSSFTKNAGEGSEKLGAMKRCLDGKIVCCAINKRRGRAGYRPAADYSPPEVLDIKLNMVIEDGVFALWRFGNGHHHPSFWAAWWLPEYQCLGTLWYCKAYAKCLVVRYDDIGLVNDYILSLLNLSSEAEKRFKRHSARYISGEQNVLCALMYLANELHVELPFCMVRLTDQYHNVVRKNHHATYFIAMPKWSASARRVETPPMGEPIIQVPQWYKCWTCGAEVNPKERKVSRHNQDYCGYSCALKSTPFPFNKNNLS